MTSSLPLPSSSSSSVSLDWHQSPEGQGVLAHLTDPLTGLRKLYGVLERPVLPPTVAGAAFKLFLVGRSGTGKSSVVSFLSGRGQASSAPVETPGVRATDVYWPAKVLNSRIVLFKLSLWDAGEAAARKYAHINPVSREGASAAIFVFSFTDRSSLDEVDAHLTHLVQQQQQQQAGPALCPIVIGNRYGSLADAEVTNADVAQFESRWRLPVCRIRHFATAQPATLRSPPNPNEVAAVLNVIVDRLWTHQQQHRHQRRSTTAVVDPSLI